MLGAPNNTHSIMRFELHVGKRTEKDGKLVHQISLSLGNAIVPERFHILEGNKPEYWAPKFMI